VPEYVVEESGPDHAKSFRARVRVAGELYGDGRGRSKKEAEQEAASSAYTELHALAEAVDERSEQVRSDSSDLGTDG
jgi:ribonuclease-3